MLTRREGMRTALIRLAICTAALLSAAVPRAAAHEIGTTQVVVAFENGDDYAIELTTDAAALLARLETAAGLPRSGTLDAAEYVRRITELRRPFLDHVHVTVDGMTLTPDVAEVREDASSSGPDAGGIEWPSTPQVTIRMHGTAPSRGRQLSWAYDLTYASYALVVKSAAGDAGETEWLEGGQRSRLFALDAPAGLQSRLRVAASYFVLGFTHILPHGFDHVLFVLGIFLLTRALRPMLWQVSAFTVAHSITLGLTLYGIVPEASSLVEPLIALSIVYVAVENLTTTELKPWRIALVFGFGLLHGMGFAGALRELGLARSQFVSALLAFNAGVEAGQLTVIAGASLAFGYWSRNRVAYRRFIVVPASLAIALAGAYWTVQRLSGW